MRAKIGLVLLPVMAVLFAGASAQAVIMGFVDNPTGNSVDWTNYVTGLGAVVNDNVDFEAHPLGPLQNDFYLVSDGVSFIPGGAIGNVMYGAGPGQANDTTPPTSNGEGVHPPSNYLQAGQGHSSLVISFDAPNYGAGLFIIDHFNPYGTNPIVIEAWDGPDATGNLLGSFSSVAYNFQRNKMYFMGIASSEGDIRSVRLDIAGELSDVVGLDDIRFAVPEPGALALLALGGLLLRRR